MKIKLLFLFLLFSTAVIAQQDSIPAQDFQKLENNFQEISLSIKSLSAEVESLNSGIEKLNKINNTQNNELKNLRNKNSQQENEISDLKGTNQLYKVQLDSLGVSIRENNEAIIERSNKLNNLLTEETTAVKANFSRVDETLGQNKLLWIIGILGLLIIAGLIYFLLSKKINSSKTDMESQIIQTRTSLEEEAIKLDDKLLSILETQLKLQSIPVAAAPAPLPSSNGTDHKLALKVADEIIRIQKNLERMDENTKGLKQLIGSVKRIQDNFAANGYELVEMIGKEYNEGMKVTANFIPSTEIEAGEEIITRIIKPQVNFNNEMIQAAQIEVSIGE
jgi:DNA repair exonuclease SbcCD ATPase subunit